jgi:ADP-L-glycero-D-manno-heptose 6-epimerase
VKYTQIDFNNKTILITGGAGFIGSNLACYFQKNYPGAQIVIFDTFRSEERFCNGNLKSFGHYKNLLGFNGAVISGNINSKEDLNKLKEYEFDYIFHQAAISDTTVLDQKIMIDTNVNAFDAMCKIAVEMGSTVVYASSAAVYGRGQNFTTENNVKPGNVYGFSKLMMERIAQKYYDKLNIIGLRYFNVYGPGEYFKNSTASMILQFGLQLLKGEKAKLFEKSDKIFRDFVYIDDVVQANLKACSSKKNGIYNVGTGIARSFQDIVDILKKELQIQRDDLYIPNPYGKTYQFFTQADIKTIQKETGYQPEYSLEKGIRTYLPEIKRIYKEEL